MPIAGKPRFARAAHMAHASGSGGRNPPYTARPVVSPVCVAIAARGMTREVQDTSWQGFGDVPQFAKFSLLPHDWGTKGVEISPRRLAAGFTSLYPPYWISADAGMRREVQSA